MNTFELKTNAELEYVTGGTKVPYVVQNGDTLSELAKKFNCTLEEVCK